MSIKPDSILDHYLKDSAGKTAEDRAFILEGMEEFRKIHDKYGLAGQSDVPTEEDEVAFHYVAFVKTEDGKMIELDGLKKGPLVVKESCDDLLSDAAATIMSRLGEGVYSERISLQVLCKKPDDF